MVMDDAVDDDAIGLETEASTMDSCSSALSGAGTASIISTLCACAVPDTGAPSASAALAGGVSRRSWTGAPPWRAATRSPNASSPSGDAVACSASADHASSRDSTARAPEATALRRCQFGDPVGAGAAAVVELLVGAGSGTDATDAAAGAADVVDVVLLDVEGDGDAAAGAMTGASSATGAAADAVSATLCACAVPDTGAPSASAAIVSAALAGGVSRWPWPWRGLPP